MKRALSLLLCLCCLSPLASPALAAAQVYVPGQFSDVNDEASWYGDGGQGIIRGVYEAGLMVGRSAGRFGINENVTLAEAVTLAARLHRGYTGADAPREGEPWYQVHVDYALEHGLLEPGAMDYLRPATRADVALLFARALPAEEYAAINVVEALPDVDEAEPGGAEIFLLYRAGVLTGSDELGRFHPSSAISRQEAAALLLRVTDGDRRIALPDKLTYFSRNGFVWELDYKPGLVVNGYEDWYNVAWSAYYTLTKEYTVTFTGAPFDFDRFASFMLERYHTLTFSCYTDANGKVYLQQHFGVYDYLNVALENPSAAAVIPAAARAYGDRLQYIVDACVTPGMSEREAALALHDYVVLNASYDPGVAQGGPATYGPATWSVTGILDNGYGVCQAYSELYYLLCTMAGLRGEIVMGTASGLGGWGGHAWNVLYLDESTVPLYVDTTFDDPYGMGPDDLSHDYFLVTADTLRTDHNWK